jgi:phosphonate transport system ATP-binding protein
MEMTPAIVLRNVEVRRGAVPVLHSICLSVPHGAITAVVGASGSGKTTLLSVLSGGRTPQKGSVTNAELGNLDVPTALGRHRRRTANIYQNYALVGRLAALDNVLFGLADQRSALTFFLPWPRHVQALAAEALDEVGLLSKALVRVDDLSGGERQRVAIARALVRQPKLMIADEPFASVDLALADRFAASLRQAVRKHDMTAVIATHQIELAMRTADYVIGLAAGRIILEAPISDVSSSDIDRVLRTDVSRLEGLATGTLESGRVRMEPIEGLVR